MCALYVVDTPSFWNQYVDLACFWPDARIRLPVGKNNFSFWTLIGLTQDESAVMIELKVLFLTSFYQFFPDSADHVAKGVPLIAPTPYLLVAVLPCISYFLITVFYLFLGLPKPRGNLLLGVIVCSKDEKV